MEIRKKYISKYLHDIAMEQIADDYAKKGYEISRKEVLGKYQADLIARKGEEQIVIEIKSGRMTPDSKKNMIGLADYIRGTGGYKFLVVIPSQPKEKKLEVNNIVGLVTDYVHSRASNVSGATPEQIKKITDIDIDEMTISGRSILIKGRGVATVDLQFNVGESPESSMNETTDNFPLEFEMTLENDRGNQLKITDVAKFNINTSDYYE